MRNSNTSIFCGLTDPEVIDNPNSAKKYELVTEFIRSLEFDDATRFNTLVEENLITICNNHRYAAPLSAGPFLHSVNDAEKPIYR